MSRETQHTPVLSKEEVNRIFEKQARHEQALDEEDERKHDEYVKAKWLMERNRRRDFPDDVLAKEKRWQREQRENLATAKQHARNIQRTLQNRRLMEYRYILKQGILEGAIKIHETENGFEIDTPRDKVAEYVRQHRKPPTVEDLRQGRFLLGSVSVVAKEQVKLLREALIDEFGAEDPSDLMLIDIVVSNYYRAMYATKLEMESLLWATDDRMEMFEVNAKGAQPYINACQKQFLKTLDALRSRRPAPTPHNSITYRTFTRTDINLDQWGIPLLLALSEITNEKEEDIGLDEIKQAMSKHLNGFNVAEIRNAWIGHALRRYGFTDKVHTSEGNHYNIGRREVQLALSNEGLKL
jgi:hypothetical protein